MSTPFTITFPSLEAAVSTICEKVFGAALVIEAPVEKPTPSACSKCGQSGGFLWGEEDGTDWRCTQCLKEEGNSRDQIAALSRLLKAALTQSVRKDAEIESLKARIAELEKPSAGSDGEDLPAPKESNYRMLVDGERIWEGDEFLNPEGHWRTTACDGEIFKHTDRGGIHLPHRRKIAS